MHTLIFCTVVIAVLPDGQWSIMFIVTVWRTKKDIIEIGLVTQLLGLSNRCFQVSRLFFILFVILHLQFLRQYCPSSQFTQSTLWFDFCRIRLSFNASHCLRTWSGSTCGWLALRSFIYPPNPPCPSYCLTCSLIPIIISQHDERWTSMETRNCSRS